MIVPLIAVHMFVFYFGIMADVTPPVGLAAYAAAGIAKADPLVTGFTAFWYSIRTSVLPFMFIYNTQLLLIDIGSIPEFLLVVASAIVASLVFVAASQHWFVVRNRWYETIIMLVVAFSLFRPNFWMDMVYPPYNTVSPTDLMQRVESAREGKRLRVWVEGEDANGDPVRKGMMISLTETGSAAERLDKFGLRLLPMGGQVDVTSVKFRSRAEKAGFRQGQKITDIEVETDRPDPAWTFIPTLGVLGLIYMLQRRRREAEEGASA